LGLLLLWFLALTWFVLSLFLAERDSVLRSLRTSSAKLLVWMNGSVLPVGLVVSATTLAIAALLRMWALGHIPANFGGDEGTQALAALRLVTPPLGNPFTVGWYSVPTMSFLFYGITMRLFGATVVGARVLSGIVGTLTVLTTFLLGRTLGGRWVGWISAVVMAFSAYHIHFSRLASNQIIDPLIGTLAFWLLWRALKRTRSTSMAWGLAGMVAGMGWYTYFGARWVSVLMALFLMWRFLVEPQFLARYGRGMMLLITGALIVVLPLLVWYMAHPMDLVSRYQAVSIFSSGWLSREVALSGKSYLTLLWAQLMKAVTAFHYTHDPTFWYYPQAPLVDFITGALMLVGMIEAIWHWRWPSRGLTLLWFWPTLIMAWGVTENPPSSQRGLLLMPPVALLVAWGLQALRRLVSSGPQLMRNLVLVCLLIAAIWNVYFYFWVYTPRRVYGNPTSEIATEFARFSQANPLPDGHRDDRRIYFFGAPVIYWDFGTLAFLLRDRAGVNILPEESLPQNISPPARFVFVESRLSALPEIERRYPGGVLYELYAPDGRFLATVYDFLP
jgi:4-amino-4-deoxy-L-arabinose transferase-like glycosyltransferase